jgi:hypothetical protein
MVASAILYTGLLTKKSEDQPKSDAYPSTGSYKVTTQTVVPSLDPALRPMPMSIAVIALLTAGLALIAIAIGCSVLKKVHRHGQDLLPDLPHGGFNEYYHDREQPDKKHLWSINIFGICLPCLFIAMWEGVIIWLSNDRVAYLIGFVVADFILWSLIAFLCNWNKVDPDTNLTRRFRAYLRSVPSGNEEHFMEVVKAAAEAERDQTPTANQGKSL